MCNHVTCSLFFGISCKFPCVPCANKGHTVSPEVCAEIRRLVEVLAAHLTGQGVSLLPQFLVGGRRRSRALGRVLAIVVPAAGSGRGTTRRLAIRGCVPHFVGDEAVARQRGRGREAGAALQALQGATVRTPRLMLADVLQKQSLVFSCKAARGAAEACWVRLDGGSGRRLFGWTRTIIAVLGRLQLHGRSLFAAHHDAGVLLR